MSRTWINVIINISYYQFKNTGVPTSLHSRVSPPICSSLWCYCSYNFADGCLLSDTFSLCPNRRAGLWLGLEGAVGGEWLFLTNNQQSPGDREPHWAGSWRQWWPPRGNPPENLSLAAPCSRCSLTEELTVCFLSPRMRSHLLPAWCRQGAEGRSLRAPAAQKILDITQVVSCLFSGRFLCVTQKWGWYFQAELNYRGIKSHEEDG